MNDYEVEDWFFDDFDLLCVGLVDRYLVLKQLHEEWKMDEIAMTKLINLHAFIITLAQYF